jgi:hypothetical protein
MAAKAWNGGKWIRPEKRLAIYIRDGFQCAYCGRDLREAAPADVTLDHLNCRTHGGSNEATNLITACKSCNSSRGAREDWAEYATGGGVERIQWLRHQPLNIPLAKAIIAGVANDEVEAVR